VALNTSTTAFSLLEACNLKKPSRNEVKAALVLCIFLLASVIIFNTISQRFIYPDTSLVRPNAIVNPNFTEEQRRTLIEQYGLGGSTQTPIVVDERIKDIRQSIKGELKKGTFESVVLGIEDETETLGGYVESEDVTFADEAWSGEIVARIPQNTSLNFVFKVRSLISENGKVISIATNIKDITPTTGTSGPKPLAQIRATLNEESDKPWHPTLPTVDLPFLPGVLSLLNAFFTWIIVAVIVGVPAYFTVLAIVLFIDRALKPVTNKILKEHKK
jgi:hypothetical protein